MKIKISTREQLESVIYTWFNEHENCTIELVDRKFGGHIYYTSTKLSDDSTLLSMCVGEKSVGDTINFNNKASKLHWIKGKINIIDFENADIVAILKYTNKTNVQTKEDYRSYPETYRKVKKTTPIKIETINDALYLFSKFLSGSNFYTLIFSVRVPIIDLNHIFTLDFIVDKILKSSGLEV